MNQPELIRINSVYIDEEIKKNVESAIEEMSEEKVRSVLNFLMRRKVISEHIPIIDQQFKNVFFNQYRNRLYKIILALIATVIYTRSKRQ